MKRIITAFFAIAIMSVNSIVCAGNAQDASLATASQKASSIDLTVEYEPVIDSPYSHFCISLTSDGNIMLSYVSAKTNKETTRDGSYKATAAGANTYRIDYTLSRIKKGDAWLPSELNGMVTITINRAANKVTIHPNNGNELGVGIGKSHTFDCVIK